MRNNTAFQELTFLWQWCSGAMCMQAIAKFLYACFGESSETVFLSGMQTEDVETILAFYWPSVVDAAPT